MKRQLVISPIVALLLFGGCQQFQPLSKQNTDQVILRAEQTAQTARATFNLFVNLERENEALLKGVDPKIHDYANTIRRHGLDWITSLRTATKTFKAARTPANEANLQTWLTTLTNAVLTTNQYITQSKGAIGQ